MLQYLVSISELFRPCKKPTYKYQINWDFFQIISYVQNQVGDNQEKEECREFVQSLDKGEDVFMSRSQFIGRSIIMLILAGWRSEYLEARRR